VDKEVAVNTEVYMEAVAAAAAHLALETVAVAGSAATRAGFEREY